MKKTKVGRTYETIFVVEGFGEFPLDMLRYDSAFPMSERDAHIAGNGRTERRRVALISRRVNDNLPSAERWLSFLWHVVGVFAEKIDAEAARDTLAPARGMAGV